MELVLEKYICALVTKQLINPTSRDQFRWLCFDLTMRHCLKIVAYTYSVRSKHYTLFLSLSHTVYLRISIPMSVFLFLSVLLLLQPVSLSLFQSLALYLSHSPYLPPLFSPPISAVKKVVIIVFSLLSRRAGYRPGQLQVEVEAGSYLYSLIPVIYNMLKLCSP